ncbi:hypothetical protein [Nocardia sp. NPDC005978]|uniref:hypothetical protein n=1 Tax=unclassified Nocardia TaxID=2637762 RepID=UPI0033A4680E
MTMVAEQIIRLARTPLGRRIRPNPLAEHQLRSTHAALLRITGDWPTPAPGGRTPAARVLSTPG